MFDLSKISPEERKMLLNELQSFEGASASASGHPDAAEDKAMIEPLITVIEQMLNKIEAMDEEIDKLSKLVLEDIIGGVTNLYNEKEKISSISSLSEKYKDKFDPYKDFYSEVSGEDLYEKLFEELQEAKAGTPEWNEETENGKIDELVNLLKGKFEKVKSMGEPIKVGTTEVEMEVKAEPELSKDELLKQKIGKMKKAAGDVKYN